MSENWVVNNLETAIGSWNNRLVEMWEIITQSPAAFKDGAVWSVMVGISSTMQGIGYGLLVLFFAMGVCQSAASFRDLQRPEFALRYFIRFVGAKVAVGYAMDLMVAIYNICGGIVQSVMASVGSSVEETASLPDELVTAIEGLGLLESIPLWLVSFLGSLVITVLSFVLILTVYGRFFKLYLFTALAPLPLSTFAGENVSSTGKAFLKSYVGVGMEGAVIVLACLIYSAFISGGVSDLDTSLPAVTMAWQYLGELIFNMLILSGLIRGSERVVREMLGL